MHECFVVSLHARVPSNLRAQLVGLGLGLLLESVVGVVVRKGVLDERGKHKHVADPEVHVQRLDGRRPRQRGACAHHQRCHGEHRGDPCKMSTWQPDSENALVVIMLPFMSPNAYVL